MYIYIYVLFVDFTPAGAEAVWSRALIGSVPSVLASRKFLILEGTSRSFSWAVKAAAPVEICGRRAEVKVVFNHKTVCPTAFGPR